MSHLDQLIANYGLVALFIGCLLEGETVAMAGGVLAHRHLLVSSEVTAVVALAAFTSDTLLFLLGRRYRTHPRMKRILAGKRAGRFLSAVNRHPRKIAMVFRFIPGLRIAAPLTLSQSGLPALEYVALTGFTDIIWAVVLTTLGQGLSHLLLPLVGQGHHAEPWLIAGLIAALVVGGLVLHRVLRRRL